MSSSIIRIVLKERNIEGYAKATSNGIITISLMVRTITKEDNIRSRTKFGSLVRKQNKTWTIKSIEVDIGRGDRIETFIRRNT